MENKNPNSKSNFWQVIVIGFVSCFVATIIALSAYFYVLPFGTFVHIKNYKSPSNFNSTILLQGTVMELHNNPASTLAGVNVTAFNGQDYSDKPTPLVPPVSTQADGSYQLSIPPDIINRCPTIVVRFTLDNGHYSYAQVWFDKSSPNLVNNNIVLEKNGGNARTDNEIDVTMKSGNSPPYSIALLDYFNRTVYDLGIEDINETVSLLVPFEDYKIGIQSSASSMSVYSRSFSTTSMPTSGTVSVELSNQR